MSHHRHELSDAEWAVLEPLLPAAATLGWYYRNHRTILNGMLFRNATGIPPGAIFSGAAVLGRPAIEPFSD